MKPDINNPVVERSFIRWHKKAPKNHLYPSVEVCLGDLPGGTIWFEWGNPCAKMEIYNDAFHLLPHFKDVFDMIAEVENLTEPVFCEILTELGIVERT